MLSQTRSVCPSTAEVALTPLMRAHAHCTGLQAPQIPSVPPAAGLGALITVTADKLNAADTLRMLLSADGSTRLSVILVTVDFKDKTSSADAVGRRRAWAKLHGVVLQHMAEELRKLADGVPVLVELVDMDASCMSYYLSHLAFRDYAGSGCGPRGRIACNPSNFWKNTVAFSWGLARVASCARYVVHVDNDIRLLLRPQPVPWVGRAVGVLQANESLLSIHPLRGPGPACSMGGTVKRHSDATATRASWCKCKQGRDHLSGGLHVIRSTVLAPSKSAAAACLLTYEGPHKPGVPHFSIQAFVMDLYRFQRVWPLAPYRFADYGPYDRNASALEAQRAIWLQRFELKRGIRRTEGRVDPESIFEESAHAQGLQIVYMAASELGVEKQMMRG